MNFFTFIAFATPAFLNASIGFSLTWEYNEYLVKIARGYIGGYIPPISLPPGFKVVALTAVTSIDHAVRRLDHGTLERRKFAYAIS